MPSEAVNLGDDQEFLRFSRVVWSWQACENCLARNECIDVKCPGATLLRQPPVQFWSSEEAPDGSGARSVLLSQHDLYHLLLNLRTSASTLTREALRTQIWGSSHAPPPRLDQDASVDLAVKLLTMTDCSPIDYWSDRLEIGTMRRPWNENVPFSKFVEEIMPPRQPHRALSSPDRAEYYDLRSSLKATKLLKRLGISFRPTDDVRDHLYFDSRRRELRIFRSTSFLKEQLRLTKELAHDASVSVEDTLKLGALPRQYVLELLDSVQGILFPLSDKKCRRLLSSLVPVLGLDPDVLLFEFATNRNSGEEMVPYYYLTERFKQLQAELESPPPQGWLERQVDRKSGARYMMMATLIGILFALLLGAASLALSGYQTWLTYQAWQHPVTTPDQ